MFYFCSICYDTLKKSDFGQAFGFICWGEFFDFDKALIVELRDPHTFHAVSFKASLPSQLQNVLPWHPLVWIHLYIDAVAFSNIKRVVIKVLSDGVLTLIKWGGWWMLEWLGAGVGRMVDGGEVLGFEFIICCLLLLLTMPTRDNPQPVNHTRSDKLHLFRQRQWRRTGLLSKWTCLLLLPKVSSLAWHLWRSSQFIWISQWYVFVFGVYCEAGWWANCVFVEGFYFGN